MNPLVNTSGFATSVVILATVVFFYIYYYFTTSKLPERFCASIAQSEQKTVAIFMLKKLSGFLILGFIPGVFYYFFLNHDFGKFGFSVNLFNKNILVIFSLVIIIAIVLFINIWECCLLFNVEFGIDFNPNNYACFIKRFVRLFFNTIQYKFKFYQTNKF